MLTFYYFSVKLVWLIKQSSCLFFVLLKKWYHLIKCFINLEPRNTFFVQKCQLAVSEAPKLMNE